MEEYIPDPLEREVIVDCPECGKETTAQQLYLMGCCYDCSHKAGDC